LLDLGFSHYQSVVVIYSLQLLLVICAVAMRYADDGLVIGAYLVIIVLLFVALARAERRGWRLAGGFRTGMRGTEAWFNRWRSDARSQRRALWSIALAVSGVCLFSALWASEIPRDLGMLAAVMAGGMAIATAAGLRSQPAALRVATYIAATFSAWLFVHYPREAAVSLDGPANALIMLLAVAIAAFVRFMSDQRFGATPTDFLIVFALLALALFSRITQVGLDTASTLKFVTYAIVLFYGSEVLISHFDRWRFVLGGSAFVVLLVVALRGLTSVI
jgi:UDP-GlcNAc:undecaprenyl-phosphate GlcNAc-1-phosphate transferase